MPSATVNHHRAKVAAFSRSRKPDDAEMLAAKRDLTEAKIADYVQRCLASAPPLTDEQRSRLTGLLWR